MRYGFQDKDQRVKLGFEKERNSFFLFVNIVLFASAIKAYANAINARSRKLEVEKFLTTIEWYQHYRDKITGRRVLSESRIIEYDHEKSTAIRLTQMNYDVVFAPGGMFKRDQKKFDVYLLRDVVILEADLKCISSKRADTIASRIVSGSNQANRVVVDIRSGIPVDDLIDGLRSGTGKNQLIKEVLLFYKNKYYRLPKSLIWSNKIFNILKSEKGYT